MGDRQRLDDGLRIIFMRRKEIFNILKERRFYVIVNFLRPFHSSLDSLSIKLITSTELGRRLAGEYLPVPSSIKSKSTLYRYIDRGIFTVRNIDLPRKVKWKQPRINFEI